MLKQLKALSLLLMAGPLLTLAQPAEKPNIVIILADDLGWGDVGFHGSDIQTPHIDRLAREGVVLNRYYTAPVCSPTRAGLMTGRYPNRFGLRETVIPPWSTFAVDTAETFLSQWLAEAGYRNRAALGKWHLGHARRAYLPLQRGFTHFYGHYNGAIDYFSHEREGELDWHRNEETVRDSGYSTDLITDEAVRCIASYAADDGPFFLYVAYNAPHGPLQAKEEDLRLYGYDASQPVFGANSGGADEHVGRGNTRAQTYAAMVTCMDRGIGRILAALDSLGIDNETLVLFHSDNGAAPGEGGSSGSLKGTKFQEWEGGVRSAAVIKWPDGFEGGRSVDQVTGYIDALPTLLDIAGYDAPHQKPLDGISILPVLQGVQPHIDRDFYLGYGALISGNRWKIVKADSGNPRMKAAHDKLYDIVADPAETNDLKRQHPGRFRQLSGKVARYDAITSHVVVPPYGHGRRGFVAPKDWKITD